MLYLSLAAITFWNNLVSGTLKSFGVLYLEYLDLYQRGPVMTAWLGFSFSITITLIGRLFGANALTIVNMEHSRSTINL